MSHDAVINRIVEEQRHEPGALLPILHGIQDALGYVPREAIALVAQGLSNNEIGRRMVISSVTAKTHVNRAMAKLHARDRAQLVVLAYESGLAGPSA